MMRWSAVAIAFVAWLVLSRLPLSGAALFAVAAAWGFVFGIVAGTWSAGAALLIAAILADLLAVGLGWFAYLGDFWFIPPLVGGLAGTLGGSASLFMSRTKASTRPGRSNAGRGTT